MQTVQSLFPPMPAYLGWAKHFAIALLVWSVVGYLHLMTGYFDTLSRYPEHRLYAADYAYYFLSYGSWALFSVVLYKVLDKVPPHRIRLLYPAVFLAGTLLWLPCYFTVDYLVNGVLYSTTTTLAEKLLNTPNALWFFYWIVFALTFGVCSSLLMYRSARTAQLDALQFEARRAEADLEIARQHVQILQSQLGPHFLFNCLGAISGLVRTDDKDALLNAVARVGSLLRYTVNASSQQRILLREELAFIEDYIALQSLRFGHRFRFDMHLQGEQDNVLIMPFLIQPLVENVFTHAVSHTQDMTEIQVNITVTQHHLAIAVSNTHPDCKRESGEGLGSSIANLRSRLQGAYPDAFELTHGEQQGTYRANLSIKFEAETS